MLQVILLAADDYACELIDGVDSLLVLEHFGIIPGEISHDFLLAFDVLLDVDIHNLIHFDHLAIIIHANTHFPQAMSQPIPLLLARED